MSSTAVPVDDGGMASIAPASRPEITALLAVRRAWLRKHALVGGLCAFAVLLLAGLLLAGVREGFAAGHPGAIMFDAALMGVLLSLAAGSAANAWSAWRFGSRLGAEAVETPCQVRRLAPETRMRKDYLLLVVDGRSSLVRVTEDAPTNAMAEVISGAVLGWPARRGGVVLVLPHHPPVAATVGRYHRHLPRALRAEFSAGRLGGPATD
jgi:hypothetical protein